MSEPHRLDPRRWYVADTASDRIRFTAAGRAALAVELAQAGIDIRTLRTQAQVLAALAVLSDRAVEQLASCRGQHPLLDEILAPLFDDPSA